MRKPNWNEADENGTCQWPKCNLESTMHFTQGSLSWIDRDPGVDLCDKHQEVLFEESFPAPDPKVEVGQRVWLAAMEDFPREQVYVRDWSVGPEGTILVYVSDDPKCPVDDCEEVDLEMLEQ